MKKLTNFLTLSLIFFVSDAKIDIKQFFYKEGKKADTRPLETCILCKNISKDCSLLGAYPRELSWIINDLKNNQIRRNRLILYGNPGNGKTLIAHTIAKLTGSEFHSVDTASIVHFVGDGAAAIKEEFNKAIDLCVGSSKTKVIIFFDEINNLATNTDKQGRSEHLAALTELWYHLDKFKDNSRIFIICATNSLDHFNSAFIDRFNYKIEIQDPNLDDRRELLIYYASLYKASLSYKQINYIAQNSEGSSRRHLEGLIDYLERWATNDNNKVITDKMIESVLLNLKRDIAIKLETIEEIKREKRAKEMRFKNLEFQKNYQSYLTKTALILNCYSLIRIGYDIVNWLFFNQSKHIILQ
jgi:SpoVK/Ycf46/Vps4 family AAA+-type ATPase